MKLQQSIPSNSVKIIELYNKINSEVLNTRPNFQRKLVWKRQHKFHFIETILLNYPFPEVYIASAEMDIEALTAKEIVVDGQQRLTTIVDYIKGVNDFLTQKKITPFEELTIENKRDFLNYLVTVKDLKDMKPGTIKQIFQRINNTEYSLNAIEKANAEYGDGEFVIFSKQIVDSSFKPLQDDTDTIIDVSIKNELNVFFSSNNIFSENDKKRMLDVQFIMLVVSTILNTSYFGRTSALNKYLEEYNSDFSNANEILSKILNSIRIIKSLKFAEHSYWLYKANLFILIVELSKINPLDLDSQTLESLLLELEKRVDIYFNDDDISMISEDERKYFEYSRQGSNELLAREHRGKIISNIISKSFLINKPVESSLYQINLEYLKSNGIDFSVIKPTETGLLKAVMDATSAVRDFLKRNEIHDYEKQGQGPDKKIKKEGVFIENDAKKTKTTISFYRANRRGDCRIWFSDLKNFSKANDEIAIIIKNSQIEILNLTSINYTSIL